MADLSKFDLLPGIGRVVTVNIASNDFTDNEGFAVNPQADGDITVIPVQNQSGDADLTVTAVSGTVLTFGGGATIWCRTVKVSSGHTTVQIGYPGGPTGGQ